MMMKRFQRLLILACGATGLLGVVLSVHAFNKDDSSSITFPSDPITFQAGPGSELATTYCLICHSAEYVYMQPPHSREKWNHLVHKMKQTFGCPIPESDIPALVSYLVSQNDKQPSAPLPHVKKDQKGLAGPVTESLVGHAQQGQQVFKTYCVNCHGQSGKGDGPIGHSLLPPAANLTRLQEKSDKEILTTIRKGRPGTAMPGWKHDLSPQEILDLLAYIRTLAP